MPVDKFGRHSRRKKVGFKIVNNNNLDFDGRKLTNVGTPTNQKDAVTLNYCDNNLKSQMSLWQNKTLPSLMNIFLQKNCRGQFLIRLISRDAKLTPTNHYILAEGLVEYKFGEQVDGMEIQSIRTSPNDVSIFINDKLYSTLKSTKINKNDSIKFAASADQKALKIKDRTTLGVEIYLQYQLLRQRNASDPLQS